MKIVLIGKQGSGKGTYAEFLNKKYGIPHISTGEICREIAKESSELGKKVKELIDAGNLMPDDLMVSVLKERFKRDDCKNGFVLDGFPRNLTQAQALEEITDLNVVFHFQISNETAIKRLSSRRQCRKCAKIYNLITNPPKVDDKCECGGELYQREDDKEDAIKKRLETYKQEEEDLIDFYHSIIKSIDAEKSIEEVLKALESYISELKH